MKLRLQLYTKWFDIHRGFPHLEKGYFFCSEFKAGFDERRTIGQMIETHKALCEEATKQIAHFEKSKHIKPGHFKVHGLCKAVLVMVDSRFNDNFWSARNTPPWDRRDMKFFWKNQDVVLICTSDNSGLSKPLDLKPLLRKESGAPKSLLREADGHNYRFNHRYRAVRVRIGHAVEFLADRLKAEEAKMSQQEPDNVPILTLDPDELHITTDPIMDDSKGKDHEKSFPDAYLRVSADCDEWIEQQMKKAEDDGIDNVKPVWEVMIRWRARKECKQRWERSHRIEQWPALLDTTLAVRLRMSAMRMSLTAWHIYQSPRSRLMPLRARHISQSPSIMRISLSV
jgi:hypothetical protein